MVGADFPVNLWEKRISKPNKHNPARQFSNGKKKSSGNCTCVYTLYPSSDMAAARRRPPTWSNSAPTTRRCALIAAPVPPYTFDEFLELQTARRAAQGLRREPGEDPPVRGRRRRRDGRPTSRRPRSTSCSSSGGAPTRPPSSSATRSSRRERRRRPAAWSDLVLACSTSRSISAPPCC